MQLFFPCASHLQVQENEYDTMGTIFVFLSNVKDVELKWCNAFIFQERFPKKYRHPVLDVSLTSQRTKSEARTIMRCRMNGNVN